jgi:Flp pilus assembly protein TadG
VGELRRTGSQRGQALVEFAIVIQLLLLILLAILQFGQVWMNYVAVTDAARDGARSAVVQRVNGQAAMVSAGQAAVLAAAPNLNAGQLNTNITDSSGAWAQGDPITVTVTYPYAISILGIVVSNGTLSSSTTMRAE